MRFKGDFRNFLTPIVTGYKYSERIFNFVKQKISMDNLGSPFFGNKNMLCILATFKYINLVRFLDLFSVPLVLCVRFMQLHWLKELALINALSLYKSKILNLSKLFWTHPESFETTFRYWISYCEPCLKQFGQVQNRSGPLKGQGRGFLFILGLMDNKGTPIWLPSIPLSRPRQNGNFINWLLIFLGCAAA